MTDRNFLRNAFSAAAVVLSAAFAVACASPGPSVLTSTPDDVAIEFPKSGDLGDASKLAAEECAKNGRIPRFIVVKTAATPTTRVAKFRCVSPDAAPDEAAAAGDAAPAATDAPTDADATPATDAEAETAPEASTPAEGSATP